MKMITATFASSEAARTAVEALNAADIPDSAIHTEDGEGGDTVISVTVDDGQLDAAAAILKTGAAATIAERTDPPQPNIAGHPDGSRPIVVPAPFNR